MFNGKDLHIDIEIPFAEVIREGGTSKEVIVSREVLCSICNGTRERSDSKSMNCYSCKGEGIKEDALFHRQTKCNTCKGHGKLIKSECTSCKGQGLSLKDESIVVQVDRFTMDG